MMDTDDKQSGTGRQASVLIELLTSKFAKIGALIGAVVVVLAGVANMFEYIQKIYRSVPLFPVQPEVSHANCIKGGRLFLQPGEVVYDKWRSDLTLSFRGTNTCTSNIIAYLQLRPSSSGRINILPPFDSPECSRQPLHNPECWGEITLDDTGMEWTILRPNLLRIVDWLETPETIRVKWDLMESASGTRLSTGTTQVVIKDDSKPALGDS